MFAIYAFCRTVDDIADSELTFKKIIFLRLVKKLKIFIKA